ncbi:MAG TPA: hypothetical protein VIJ50_09000 [Solirubrobacteraceae bacterium]
MDKSDQKRSHPYLDTELTPDGPDNAHVEALAQRVVELLRADDRESASRRFVDAATLAAELGVERSWIYEHANELHPIRLGTGPKARLRFDVRIVRGTLIARSISEQSGADFANAAQRLPTRRRDRKLTNHALTVGRVLAVRPRDAS